MRASFFETVSLEELLNERGELRESLKTGDSQRSGTTTAAPRSVLVVDDESIIADTLVAILNGSGFSAVAAYDGESALELIAARPPNLLITDVNMPGMNGVETPIRVRRNFPSCEVLLFSGHAATADLVEEARKLGYSFHLLKKPIHPRDLLQHLRAAA